MTRTTYTIYWKHSYHGEGTFTIRAETPELAAEYAADEIAWDLVDDPDDELELCTIQDDLEVEVYEGTCLVKPLSPPLAVFE
jgi:hypothetical protein